MPATRVEPVVDEWHGEKVVDPYRWLEDGDSREVERWTARQNAYARAYLDRPRARRAELAARLEALYSAADFSTPRIYGDRYFYTRREADENQPIVYVRVGGMDAEPRIALNPNEFSEDGTVALDWWYPSPDGKLIAYGASAGGSEYSTLRLRDVDSGYDTVLEIPRTRACTVAWDRDSRGFYYVQYPEPGSVPEGRELTTRWVKHHKFGTPVEDDPIVFGQDAPENEWHDVYNSTDDTLQFVVASVDWAKNDLYFKHAGEDAFRPLAVGLDGQVAADRYKDRLIIRTSYRAPRFRIVSAPLDDPSPANWRDLVPEQSGVIQGFEIVGDRLVVRSLENAISVLRVYDFDGRQTAQIELPALGTVNALEGEHEGDTLYFTFEAYTYPLTLFRCDLSTDRLTIIEQAELDVDFDAYTTQQVWFASRDGTRVPMFVIHRKDCARDGRRPTILYGYGGFGVALTPSLRPDIFPWLDQGGVFAVANLRGGGEFGEAWHQAGRLEKKQNVFDDMIAAAEKLIADGYTDAQHLGVQGGSNGGLLVGAMITQRPDLFRAAHCAVPLLDMLRYDQFLIGALWRPEYGSASDPRQFEFLRAYSPYHNVRDGVAYPAVLFTTGASDSRVDPAHARKMTARLQAANASPHPILLRTESKAGHGAGKPMSKRLAEKVDVWVFFERELGLLEGN
ncbi:MAG: S9 family peptidase [Planctomycetota bacterium]|nr:MAG: S9 family peptidase [Planctomycetota bacterium]